jgi:hypothetical protein
MMINYFSAGNSCFSRNGYDIKRSVSSIWRVVGSKTTKRKICGLMEAGGD